jgi:hypothetical protein
VLLRLELVLISIFFLLSNDQNKSRIEWFVWRQIFRNFQRHPLVSDDRTNSAIGIGNGMARTSRETITFYRLIRKLKKKYSLNTAIDLGCGDGVAVRYFELSGLFSVGIEFDQSLSSLAQINNPQALIISGDITESQVVDKTIKSVKSNFANRKKQPKLLVYAFNPIEPALLLGSLNLFASNSNYILLLKNPKCLPFLLLDKNYKIVKESNNGNLVVLEVGQF